MSTAQLISHLPSLSTGKELRDVGFPVNTVVDSENLGRFCILSSKNSGDPLPLQSEIEPLIPLHITTDNGERTYDLHTTRTGDGYQLCYMENGEVFSMDDGTEYVFTSQSKIEALCQIYITFRKDGIIDERGHVRDGLITPEI